MHGAFWAKLRRTITRGEGSYGASRARTCSPRPSRKLGSPDRVIYVKAGDETSVLIYFEEGLRHGGLGVINLIKRRTGHMSTERPPPSAIKL
jgi:hypothetical protein